MRSSNFELTSRSSVVPFEAALIHLRNLMEFLLRSPHDFTHPATLQPEHFGVMNHPDADARHRFEDWRGKDPDDLFADICTFVSHLSVNREQPEEGVGRSLDVESISWCIIGV